MQYHRKFSLNALGSIAFSILQIEQSIVSGRLSGQLLLSGSDYIESTALTDLLNRAKDLLEGS